MEALPPITISTLDAARLEKLLARQSAHHVVNLAALENELARATVLAPEAMPADVVTMRSRVLFEILPAGRDFELTLCYPDEVDGRAEQVSILAPIGSAILGLSVGQEITWPAPGGAQLRVRIKAVSWQPERAGMFLM
ncbi:nucleoside diphosphate kinase regulator [Chitinibacter fontanus]|uniref:Nucleoside diphosphate kinase regulator n=1 Tax=Chitinibacter fontanus TaxID=1737446 RepID=A0A7D5V9T0_9NEIS|nr:nucleoside diphosphate kinase regulator [Chitinibacter fontanus]QLI81671.1 nucleoside diphosphate kinase regulator [Chitinibacter fontanus]